MTLFRHKTQVLMVCTENICRSPMAEGLLRHHLQHSEIRHRVKVLSAGTRATWPGSKPDQRAQRAAALAGINLGRIRARRVTERDFKRSDLILAMDRSNVRDLAEVCPAEHQHKINLLLSYLDGYNLEDVPDPYYGSIEGFEEVFHLIDAAVGSLVSYMAGQM